MYTYHDYKILEASRKSDLEKEVKKYLENGYQLAGGVSISIYSEFDTKNYCQAVYKKD